MAKLKVFSGLVHSYDARLRSEKYHWINQFRASVATTSKKRAAQLIGVSLYDFNRFWNEPRREDGRSAFALANAERVWAWPNEGANSGFGDKVEGAVDVTREPK